MSAAAPAHNILASADPYNIGFPAVDLRQTGRRQVAQYELDNGSTAYMSYGEDFGHAVVIRDRNGVEVLARRVENDSAARAVVGHHMQL